MLAVDGRDADIEIPLQRYSIPQPCGVMDCMFIKYLDLNVR
jgi:hypothetical protein